MSGLKATNSAKLRTEEQKRKSSLSSFLEMFWAKWRAEVLALQCHFFAGSVCNSNPTFSKQFRVRKSTSCLWEPPKKGSIMTTIIFKHKIEHLNFSYGFLSFFMVFCLHLRRLWAKQGSQFKCHLPWCKQNHIWLFGENLVTFVFI